MSTVFLLLYCFVLGCAQPEGFINEDLLVNKIWNLDIPDDIESTELKLFSTQLLFENRNNPKQCNYQGRECYWDIDNENVIEIKPRQLEANDTSSYDYLHLIFLDSNLLWLYFFDDNGEMREAKYIHND